MTFFETIIALLALAMFLLQLTRRMNLPYPGILAAAGVAVAMLPGAPTIPIDPPTALALFIAPVLVDAAYDFPARAARRIMLPLVFYAIIAVVVTACVVMFVGVAVAGLPIAVAFILGAIVAPPDAAASSAVLSNLPVSRRVDTLLTGESLFNDATALLLFGAALTVQEHGGITRGVAVELAMAAPAGVLFGVGFGLVIAKLRPLTENTVRGTLLQFVYAFLAWLVAEHLHLSAVLATVASALTIATLERTDSSPRMRVHSFAVWTTVVFVLNVIAFLLMGIQARSILSAMQASQFQRAAYFAVSVVFVVIITRIAIAFLLHALVKFLYNRGKISAQYTAGESFLVGWSGMRGLVTLATAFALPEDFPERDLIVLTAFAVVLATLVIQGVTLAPIIKVLKLDRGKDVSRETDAARRSLAEAAFHSIEGVPGPEADALRAVFSDHLKVNTSRSDSSVSARRRHVAMIALAAQRQRLAELLDRDEIGPTQYLELQEDLDWRQLSVGTEQDRRIIDT